LAIGPKVTLFVRTFVPIDSEPAQIRKQLLLVLFLGALDVRILHTQDESSAVMPGKKPIEKGRPSIPHVDVAGRARRKPNPNLGHGLVFSHPLTITHQRRLGRAIRNAHGSVPAVLGGLFEVRLVALYADQMSALQYKMPNFLSEVPGR